MKQDATQEQSRTSQNEPHEGIDTTVKQDAAQTQNLAPQAKPHYDFGTTEALRFFDYINTWKALVLVAAFFLIVEGFIIYRYGQPEKNSVPEPPTTASTSQSIATSAEDGEGRRAEAQSEDNGAQTDDIDQEQQDSSTYLRGTYPVAQKEMEDSANEAAQQAQERMGETADQAQGAAGQATSQVQETVEQATEVAQYGNLVAAEQAQEAAGEAAEQAQGLGDSRTPSRVVEDEEPYARHASKQKAEQSEVDLSAVVGSVQAAA